MPVPGPIMMIGVAGSCRQREAMGFLDIDLDFIAGLDALGEEDRSDAKALALADHIAHAIHGQRQLAGRGICDDEIE